jgi:hypothetical protein
MKKITFLAILIASLSTTYGQFSFSVPVGISSLKVPTIGANVQCNIRGFIIGTGFDAHMSRKISNGDYYWAKLGRAFRVSRLNTIEISAGAGQYRRSAEIKSLNKSIALVNWQYVHQMDSRNEGALFLSLTGTQKFTIITGGLRFIFQKRERGGCPSTRIR